MINVSEWFGNSLRSRDEINKLHGQYRPLADPHYPKFPWILNWWVHREYFFSPTNLQRYTHNPGDPTLYVYILMYIITWIIIYSRVHPAHDEKSRSDRNTPRSAPLQLGCNRSSVCTLSCGATSDFYQSHTVSSSSRSHFLSPSRFLFLFFSFSLFYPSMPCYSLDDINIYDHCEKYLHLWSLCSLLSLSRTFSSFDSSPCRSAPCIYGDFVPRRPDNKKKLDRGRDWEIIDGEIKKKKQKNLLWGCCTVVRGFHLCVHWKSCHIIPCRQ